MSTPGARVYASLSGTSAITDEVSTRIRPGVLEQEETLPAIVYTIVGGQRQGTLQGDGGLSTPRCQIDVYASSVDAAGELHELIRAALKADLKATADEPAEVWDPEPERHRVTADYFFPHTDND